MSLVKYLNLVSSLTTKAVVLSSVFVSFVTVGLAAGGLAFELIVGAD